MDFESIDWIVCQNFENKDYFVYLVWRLPACTRYRKFECVSLDLNSVGIIFICVIEVKFSPHARGLSSSGFYMARQTR